MSFIITYNRILHRKCTRMLFMRKFESVQRKETGDCDFKLNSCCVWFWNYAYIYDLRPNCTPLSSITIINQVKHYLCHTCVDYLFRQIYQNLVNFSLLDVWFSALYWSWKDLNQDRKKSSYLWSQKKSTVAWASHLWNKEWYV